MEHSAGKIIKNTIIFTAAAVMQKIVSFAYFLYLSSRLAPELLGSYVWALSFTTLFSIGTDLGLSPIFIREAAKGDENDEKYIRNTISIKLPLIFITLIACYAVLFLTKADWQIRLLVIAASAVMSFDALSLNFYSFFRAKQKLNYESVGIVGFQIISLLGGILMLELTHNIIFVMLALALASIANCFYSAMIIKLKYGYTLRPAYDKKTIIHFLRLIPAFALSGIFIRVYNVFDSVLLGYLKGNLAVGLYSIPIKIFTALQSLIPGALAATIYPGMSNFYVTSRDKFRVLFEKSFNYLGLISVPLAIGLYAAAEPIISKIWPKYVEATPAFKIMSLALPFIFLAYPTGLLLRATNRQNANTLNRGIITAASVALNLMLIPPLGVLGAGITFLSVSVLLLILDLIFVSRTEKYNFKSIVWYFARVIAAGLGMVLILNFVLQRMPLYGAIAAGAAAFVLLAALFRVIKKSELVFLKNILIKKNVAETSDNN